MRAPNWIGPVVALMSLGLGALAPSGATAQARPAGVEVTAPPPARPPGLGLEPAQPPEQRGVREQEFYPEPIKSRHEPAFVTPFVATVPVTRTSGARVGLSGWIAPRVPFDMREANGGLALGLTVLWGVPIEPAAAPEPAGGQR